ncbi:MAG: nucleotidyltransferase domain-containing protein [Methanosarcinales archaeon]|uniref:Nucleotidyltransferase domain-containing protein n=1 Tax=Candidatus Ethanoperedens thermophilum TaxID=2766897 RepID=A0A848D5U0_9EURY|nr:nucleotidyltransferase domain-containing protein [Candidatus Ethanoperedens thermophilum]
MNKKQIAKEFANEVKRMFGGEIENITLFGSVARGEDDTESDIDVLIIWNGDNVKGWDKLEEMAFDIFIRYNTLISIKLISPAEYKNMENFLFMKDVRKEGVVIG